MKIRSLEGAEQQQQQHHATVDLVSGVVTLQWNTTECGLPTCWVINRNTNTNSIFTRNRRPGELVHLRHELLRPLPRFSHFLHSQEQRHVTWWTCCDWSHDCDHARTHTTVRVRRVIEVVQQ